MGICCLGGPGDAAYQPPGAPSGQDTQILHQKQRQRGWGMLMSHHSMGLVHALSKKAHLSLEAWKHSISLDILLATQIHFVGKRYWHTWCWSTHLVAQVSRSSHFMSSSRISAVEI